ncbi:hypothetical protein Ancab_030572 [Ancistrocladus abbreviatus]
MTSSNPVSSDLVSSVKEELKPMNSRIGELHGLRSEQFRRIQSLKLDLQNWRSKVETQAKIYSNELVELKNALNIIEAGQLQPEFQDSITSLQQQQKDATASLRNLGLQDASRDEKAVQEQKINEESAQDIKIEPDNAEISSEENDAEDLVNERNKQGAEISPANAKGEEANN